ncbi:MAG: hypothetical protein LAO20_11245 [Acidobacteriia bacterium]|nr:hypothetical protein [Terriglobia bacterium]
MIVALLVLALLLAAAVVIFRKAMRLSEPSANDVPLFLQKIEMDALYGAFHPEAEQRFRDALPADEFKHVQWKRIHLAIHYCNILTVNALIFQGWTRYERRVNWEALDTQAQETLFSLRDACLQCRMSAFVVRLRLRWWLVKMALLPFLAPPSFDSLLRMGSGSMIAFYENAKTQAEAFSHAYGEEYHQKLAQAL